MNDLRTSSDAELRQLLASKRSELAKASMQVSQQQLKNVRLIRSLRKTIAQILTVLGERMTTSSTPTT
jgi:ribosomal protein L29